MPVVNNFNAFLGAAVLGVISAAELTQVRRELDQLLAKREKIRKPRRSKSPNSVISVSTTDDYLSANISLSGLKNALKGIDMKLDTGSLQELEDIIQKLNDLCIEYPKNPELLWRIGKAHQKISDKSDDKNFIQDHISKGIKACSVALELKADSADIHKWYAILVGSRSDFVSLQEKISDGHLFKKHVDAALSFRPSDPSLHHMLGRFDFEVASLKWYERKVASALFGEPPNSTYQEALEHFMQAEDLADFEWKENKLMIAKCKISTGDYKEAVEWLQKADNCKQADGADDKIDTEVKQLLEKYNSYR
ncbi:hypothetical protein JTB14_022904 [Gonioctena quinquepunctata]|nr:hypothetical protein JTB14_022904 [Gonioctena quinquepunctata]